MAFGGWGCVIRASTISKTYCLSNAFKKDMVLEWGGREGDNRENRDLRRQFLNQNNVGLEMGDLMLITGITGT